jgi:hypothetical protein
MPLLIAAALMLAQAPAATPPAQPAQPTEKKKKPKQICENFQVTGSYRPQRVCRDENGIFRLGPDVANDAPNSGMFHPPPPAPRPAGVGGTPK